MTGEGLSFDIFLRDLLWEPPQGTLDEDWVRWHGLEGTVILRFASDPEERIDYVPTIQFVRSLDYAVGRCEREGRAEWDLYDVGSSYKLKSRGDEIVIGDEPNTASVELGTLRQLIARLRSQLLSAVEGEALVTIQAVLRASTPDFY